MTYLEKWFDYNRRQKEMEALLEETIAQQSEQRLTLKEFYLLYYLDLANEKILTAVLIYLINSISVPALFLEWWPD